MAEDLNLDKFIGKGLSFPIQLDSRGAAVIDRGLDLVRKSILTAVNWPHNTRWFLSEFGSRIEEVLDEPNDIISHSLIIHFIIEVINSWDKRVEPLEIKVVKVEENKVEIQVHYKITNTQIEDSFIFPFYRKIIF